MPKTLILTEDAQQDLDEAFQWYQEQNHGKVKNSSVVLTQNFQKLVVILFTIRSFFEKKFIEH